MVEVKAVIGHRHHHRTTATGHIPGRFGVDVRPCRQLRPALVKQVPLLGIAIIHRTIEPFELNHQVGLRHLHPGLAQQTIS